MASLSDPKEVPDDFFDKLAALWPLLVPEAERMAMTNDKVARLTVIPSAGLALLPFEAMLTSQEDKLEFLLDVGPPIAYAPSASVMLSLAQREGSQEAAAVPVFTLGDPAYPQPDVPPKSSRTSDDSVRAHLSRLLFSNQEAHDVQDRFKEAGVESTLVTGVDATETAIRHGVPGRRIVHLACHGGAEQSYSNFFGALYVMPGPTVNPVDDGVLLMSEVYELDLASCELAVLSACQTNYGPEQRGEGVWALSRGFLVAGARRVMASNWVISDQAGATLVGRLAGYLSKSGAKIGSYQYAKSLQQAKRDVRNDKRWTHPFYWSSLVLIGPE